MIWASHPVCLSREDCLEFVCSAELKRQSFGLLEVNFERVRGDGRKFEAADTQYVQGLPSQVL